MSEVLEFAARLSTVVGARPAGTEEEQQASFFIEEVMSEAGLDTSVEEFSCNPNYELSRIACCIASIVLAVLAICLPLMVVPALIVCAIAAVFYVLEILGASPLTNATKGGVSQNVIAKYYPGMSIDKAKNGLTDEESPLELDKIDGKNGSKRRRHRSASSDSRSQRKRKIVILARYDTGRVRAELKPPLIGILDKIQWVEMGGMVLVPLALLLRVATGAIDDMHIVWDILVGIGAFCSLLPVIAYIQHQTAAYSEGANNNASGVAVMTELAKRLVASTKPSLSSKVLPNADGLSFSLPVADEDPTVIAAMPELGTPDPLPILHGKDAIVNAEILPVDTDLIYDEAANGTLDKGKEYITKPENEGHLEPLPNETVAYTPVAVKEVVEEEIETKSGSTERQSALSLEAQMKSASMEFAKYDEQQEESDSDVWTRLQREAASKNESKAASPAVTADLLGAQTITIGKEPSLNNDPNVPDWFKKGMAAATANKSENETEKPVQRSRFADALDAAHETSTQARDLLNTSASGIDRARLDELHARIMGDVPERVAPKSTDDSPEAKAERKAKLKAARDAKMASKEEIGDEEIVNEREVLEEIESDAETIAAIEAKVAAQEAAQIHAAEEVAEQAAVADRTISFIPVAADIPTDVRTQKSITSSHDPVKMTAEEILEEAASLTGSHEPVSVEEDSESIGRRSISLPSLTVSKDKRSGMQNAPLAEDAERAKGEARTALKNVGGEVEYKSSASREASAKKEEVAEGVAHPLEGATTSFLQKNEADALAALSTLDGVETKKKPSARPSTRAASSAQEKKPLIPTASDAQQDASTDAQITVSTAGSFVQKSQTSNFKPVGDELIANMDSEDIIVEDVDDSDYTENITHTGAIAGPGYVEMPKSRMSRLKSFFGKKKTVEEDSISFSDAVGIDNSFDAREVGKARGGWESFKNNSTDFDASNGKPVISAPPQSSDRPAYQGQANSGQLAGQVPMQPQGGIQVPQQMRGNSQNLHPNMPQQMPPQGQMPMPMPGQFPMQGQMPPQGRMPQQMPPQGQGQMPVQYQAQMQFSMQAQAQQIGQPQQLPGQPMQGQQSQSGPVQGGPMSVMGTPSTPQRGLPIDQQQKAPSMDLPSDDAEPKKDDSEKPAKKSRSFSFFRKKNDDGDMNSGAFDDYDDWNGGAFSLGRDKDPSDSSRQRSHQPSRLSRHSSRNQSMSGGRRRSADEVLAEEAMAEMAEDELLAQDMLDERDQIRNFRSSSTQLTSFEEVAAFASSFSKKAADEAGVEYIDETMQEEPDIGFQTEVWFVALGAELANNAGIKNLLSEHGDELRGAVVIDIDAFGAGNLSIIEEEGILKRVKSSTRLRRYATKAAAALGIKLGTGKILWRESAAYYTTKRGLLTMHLCGMAGDKPAYAGEIDDTFDKLSEEKMLENTAFMLELINAI